MATRRRCVKTSRRKHTFRNKTKNNRTTRRINMLAQDGGLRIFNKSNADARWGKRIEKLVIQKMLTPEQYEGQLEAVLNLRNQEPNDIPARLYIDPETRLRTNVSIKAKQQSKSKVITIDAGYPINILNTLAEREHPYHMIFVTYIMYGPKKRMSIVETRKLDLKKMFSKLVPLNDRAKLLSDIQKLSDLIKSKTNDIEAVAMSKRITSQIATKSNTIDVVWKINAKISSSNHRIQCTLTIDFDSPFVKSCIIEVGDTFASLSSAESEDGAPPRRWMSREPDASASMREIVRPTPKISVGPRNVASAASARSGQGLLKQSPVVKLTPRASPSGRTSASSRNPEQGQGISKPSRFSRSRASQISQKQIAELMARSQQFIPPSPSSSRGRALSRIPEESRMQDNDD